ncbi:MAG: NAD(P)-dependent oxidoreductase [Nitrosomonadales bacterium]|nr:NAD(P)-dependent oxidoreductase [Nitrosomonadales bacterium]
MNRLPPLPQDDLLHILEHTRHLWRDLDGERIFITGGTGFFGVWLLETLAAANSLLNIRVEATVLSRDPESFQAKLPHLAGACSWLKGDVRDFPFPAGTFSHVIHAASSTDARFNASAPAEALETIIGGTRRVLDFAAAAGTAKLLLTSSGAVYGTQSADIPHMPEAYLGGPDTTSPDSIYAEGKRVAELQMSIAARHTGLSAKIARCYCFTGPHLPLDWHFAIGNFMGDALAGRKLTVRGDGRPLRSYLHAADLVIWLLGILSNGISMRPYNVGSEEACSIADLAKRVARISGLKDAVSIMSPEGDGPAPRYVPDTSRARQELGLQQTIALDDAIARTLAWWRTAA